MLVLLPVLNSGLFWLSVGLLYWGLVCAPCFLSLLRELLRIWVVHCFRSYGRLAEFLQFNLFGDRQWRQFMAIESLAALMGGHLEGIAPKGHGLQALEVWRGWWNNVEGRLEFDEIHGDWLIHPAANAADHLPGRTM